MADELNDLTLSRTFRITEGDVSDTSTRKASTNLLGIVIDSKYRVLALLGEGGMGSVYRVQHLLLNKEVALKTFRTANLNPDAWQRFQREAQAIGKLNHANIIKVFDFGIYEQNFPYYTMELLSGESLADRLEHQKRLEIEEALSIFCPVADGLAHAHRQGIVHRDVKPGNIFLEGNKGEGRPRIVDFGLAKLAEFENLEGQALTATGLVFGSPLYMSPEQSKGVQTDRRTDIYSFGCSLFQALTGKPPFAGDNFLATISMHQQTIAPSLSSVTPDVIFPERLQAIVAKLMAKDLDKRYQSFEEVSLDLLDFGNTWRRKVKLSAAATGSSNVKAASLADPRATSAKRSAAILVVVVVVCVFVVLGSLSLNAGYRNRPVRPQVQNAKGNIGAAPLLSKADQVPATVRFSTQEEEEEGLKKYLKGDAPVSASSEDADNRRADQSFTPPRAAFCHPGPNGSKIFSFPTTGPNYGVIRGHYPGSPAKGEIKIPRGVDPVFTPGEAFYQHPELFKLFKADDLAGLNLLPDWKWEERHFSQIWHLSGLKFLMVRKARLTGSCVQGINSFRQLTLLDVSDASVSGLDLSRLACLPSLDALFINGIIGTGPVLDKLQYSKALAHLEVEKCGLRDDDFKKIGTITELKQLSAAFNDITADGIKNIAGLHSLVILRLTDNPIGPEAINAIGQFKKLKELSLETRTWPRTEQDRLKQACPSTCKIGE